jgi:hypothetical protein
LPSPKRSILRLEVTTLEHMAEVAQHMRQADVAEVLSSHGLTPAQALAVSLNGSAFARTLFIDDHVAAIFGVRKLADVAEPWALTTDAVDRFPVAFMRASRRVVRKLLPLYPELRQCIDARHTQALGWLQRLGFTVAKRAHPCGLARSAFFSVSLKAGSPCR